MSKHQDTTELYPTVVMDIRLGETYSEIDFNYSAFAEECAIHDLPLETAADLTILLENRSNIVPGYFDPIAKELRVKAGRHSNQRLSHELSHAADLTHDRYDGTILAAITHKTLVPAVYTAIGATGLTIANGSLALGLDKEVIAWVDYGIVFGLGILTLGHAFDAGERRANKAARYARNDIFRMTKR